LARKEVYATTGPRITLRFFGGWSFQPKDADAGDLAAIGYRKGVPMGADLPKHDPVGPPSFLIAALHDPLGASLDRIQVIKGWRDAAGETLEKVYDVAWSGADSETEPRRIDTAGRLTPVVDAVDRKTATYSNEHGAAALKTVWHDPDFSANEPAFYYVRVLEVPTPRWTDYDAAAFGTDAPGGASKKVNQDRAYSSPIWYVPASP
jgi:hypothetical protein